MARNHKFFFDSDGTPRARGPAAERMLMTFLEVDVQGSDHVCHDLMEDLVAVGDGSDDLREFVGNAHRVTISPEGVLIETLEGDESAALRAASTDAAEAGDGAASAGEAAEEASEGAAAAASTAASTAGGNGAGAKASYRTGLKHFREVLEDWEVFILDDELEDDSLLDDDFA